MPRDATPARTPRTALLALVFSVLLVQICPLKLVAANRASGWFSPHCDGASFFLTKVDSLPAGQKPNMAMPLRPPLVELPPAGGLGRRLCGTVLLSSKMRASRARKNLVDEGDAKDKRVSGKYDVISADSILMEHSSLNTESKSGFANELSGVPIEMLIAR